ncbi:MAG: hypothetical protein KJ058_12040 [Thermoanaerobaculia bacterium]|nr:hypothetical protein [Thermoanaerobaculia bacterium]MCZ7651474.1 hypothetical protein [Thermoanaerobaculia bacterium]
MRTLLKIASVAVLALLATVGCQSRTDKTDGGGVLLSITDFDGLPVVVSAADGPFQIDEIEVQSVVKDPTGSTSALMNVELESYQVTFARADTGSRVPPVLVEYVFGVVPVNGNYTLFNPPFMRFDQLNNLPIKDLLDYGYDRETGSQVIRLTVGIRFFGRTLSGKKVDSAPAYFTIDVVP